MKQKEKVSKTTMTAAITDEFIETYLSIQKKLKELQRQFDSTRKQFLKLLGPGEVLVNTGSYIVKKVILHRDAYTVPAGEYERVDITKISQ